jgi:hypothetical protein
LRPTEEKTCKHRCLVSFEILTATDRVLPSARPLPDGTVFTFNAPVVNPCADNVALKFSDPVMRFAPSIFPAWSPWLCPLASRYLLGGRLPDLA